MRPLRSVTLYETSFHSKNRHTSEYINEEKLKRIKKAVKPSPIFKMNIHGFISFFLVLNIFLNRWQPFNNQSKSLVVMYLLFLPGNKTKMEWAKLIPKAFFFLFLLFCSAIPTTYEVIWKIHDYVNQINVKLKYKYVLF